MNCFLDGNPSCALQCRWNNLEWKRFCTCSRQQNNWGSFDVETVWSCTLSHHRLLYNYWIADQAGGCSGEDIQISGGTQFESLTGFRLLYLVFFAMFSSNIRYIYSWVSGFKSQPDFCPPWLRFFHAFVSNVLDFYSDGTRFDCQPHYRLIN
jgi:hypothetical protein